MLFVYTFLMLGGSNFHLGNTMCTIATFTVDITILSVEYRKIANYETSIVCERMILCVCVCVCGK